MNKLEISGWGIAPLEEAWFKPSLSPLEIAPREVVAGKVGQDGV